MDSASDPVPAIDRATTPPVPRSPRTLRRRARWALVAGAGAALLAGAAALGWGQFADHPATDLAPPTPSALALTTPDLDLPTSAEAVPGHDPFAITVLVTRKELLIGGDPRPVATFADGLRALGAAGLPAHYKRGGQNDLYLQELGNGLTFWRDAAAKETDAGAATLAVVADGSTPYRVLVEVLFTGGQSGFDRFDIAARTPDGRIGWLVSRPPRTSGHLAAPSGRPALAPSVFVADAGYAIKARGGNLAPGCDAVGPGVAVPKIGGAYDTHGLTTCLRKIKEGVPEAKDETRITLVANPSIELSEITSTMDALKGTPASFPDVDFGVPGGRSRGSESRESVPGTDTPDLQSLAGPSGPDAGPGSAVSGGSVAQASPVIASMSAGFRRCYNKGLAEDPNMKGSVRITAKIGRSGEVISVSPSSATGLSNTVVSCVLARVASAIFAPPEGGSATVVIPVSFVSE